MQATNQPIIKIEDLVKRYKSLVAIDHLSLAVNPNDIFGLLGPNGSGKSTLINCIVSLLSYDHGTIHILDEVMSPKKYHIKQQIGLVPQELAFYEEISVYDNIDYFCGLYITDRKVRKQYVWEAIKFVGLESFAKFLPKKLSGGLKRRLNLACGIAHKPKIIILDEPTVAIDPQSRNHVLENIKLLNKHGSTIIYTSHYMEEVEILCNNIAILDKGKLLAQGSSQDIINQSSIQEQVKLVTYNLPTEILNDLKVQPHLMNVNYDNITLSLQITHGGSNALDIIKKLQQQEVLIQEITILKPTLNDVFLEITGKELRDYA